MSLPDGSAESRVVITGLGPVSSIGTGVGAFRDSLRAGRAGCSPIRSFDSAGFPHIYAGEVHDFAPGQLLRRIDPARWGRSSQFAATAARLAIADAALEQDPPDPVRIGVV